MDTLERHIEKRESHITENDITSWLIISYQPSICFDYCNEGSHGIVSCEYVETNIRKETVMATEYWKTNETI